MRFFLFLVFYIFVPIENLQIVTTNLGKIRGITEYSEDGNSKHIFKGIPFAKPPIGELRFKLPQNVDPWSGVRDASTYSSACISDPAASTSKQKSMNEDCLYVNIFTSDRCLNFANCSVIIYYHGGGFRTDSAVMFPDKFILDRYVSKDIVFAIPAYRLGVFGLLNVGDENVVDDNLAVHDCVHSLHFLHENIKHFGGNYKNVTIMGHSSGASIVGFFAFSKLVDPQRKLFQRVIALSGSMSLGRRELLERTSMEIAENVGCMNTTKQNIVDCLRTIDAFELLKAQSRIEKEKGHYMRQPIRGPPLLAKEGILEDWLHNITKRDILIGTTEFEMGKNNKTDINPTLAGGFMDFENPYEVASEFSRLKSENSDWFSIDTQAIFAASSIYSAAMTNSGGNVFLYETRQGHSTHSSDLQYFIGIHQDENLSFGQKVLDSIYSDFIVNFTKTGVPIQNWKPVISSQMNYVALQFNLTENIYPSMETDYHKDIVDFWKINMTKFDRRVTMNKKVTKVPFYPGPVFLPTIETTTNEIEGTISDMKTTEFSQSTVSTILKEGSSLIFSQWWFYLLILLVIFILLFVVFYICRSRSEEMEPLIG